MGLLHTKFKLARIWIIRNKKNGEKDMGILVGILWIVCSLAVWYIFHQLFDVFYFSIADGCLKECLVCAFVGAILTALIVTFWYISIPLVILVIVAIAKRNS